VNIDYIIKLFLPTSDVVVVAGEEKFYCHKIILSARCEVFKNMLAPNTIESETNTISEYIFLRCSRMSPMPSASPATPPGGPRRE